MAAVAKTTTNDSPRLVSRMTSPTDAKKPLPVAAEEAQKKDSPLDRAQDSSRTSPPQSDTNNTRAALEDAESDAKSSVSTLTNAQPLGPPPKPSQTSNAEEVDYFSTTHSTNFNLEPNPFEQSFGNNPGETPGKTLLPPVASLTSPSSLLPGGTPGWTNSLRSGPLSPAMLAGPTGSGDYFSDSHFRGGFPTPNESSLRTGLTPGGGGSMFPAQSPNSQALYNLLQGGGATPSTLDFQRTAVSAAAKANQSNAGQLSNQIDSTDTKMSSPQNQENRQQAQGDSYHDANDAANGLFMLAQANGARNNSGSSTGGHNPNNSGTRKVSDSANGNNQFAVPGPPAQAMKMNTTITTGNQSQETSPISRSGARASMNSTAQSETAGEGSESGHSEQAKPATRSRGKKGANAKSAGARRKAEATPPKAPASKKAKTAPLEMPDMDDFSDDDEMVSPKMELMEGGRKMTDEEKRKNFLERNRVAALKCRQRKKQWLQSLQQKVEYYSTENESLGQQVASLREEILSLKTLIIAHKDCPITQQQGLSGMALANVLGDFPGHHTHPYGLGMQNGLQNGMPAQGFPMAPAPPAPMHRS